MAQGRRVEVLRSDGSTVRAEVALSRVEMVGHGRPRTLYAALLRDAVTSARSKRSWRRWSGACALCIAASLHLSIKTISTHKRRIQDKLQLPSMAALIRYGMEHGLQDAPAP